MTKADSKASISGVFLLRAVPGIEDGPGIYLVHVREDHLFPHVIANSVAVALSSDTPYII